MKDSGALRCDAPGGVYAFTRGLMLGVLLLATGCGVARVRHASMSDEQRAQIRSARTIVNLPQDMLRADHHTVPLMAPAPTWASHLSPQGLAAASIVTLIADAIAISINASNHATAEVAAWPIRDTLLGYDPRAALCAALS